MEHNYHMYYDNPAKRWGNALPLGNGRLGAMVYGETDMERITLNDDSLWYGLAMDRNNPAYRQKLPEIRRLILDGKMHEAEELIAQYMAGVPYSQRPYTFLGHGFESEDAVCHGGEIRVAEAGKVSYGSGSDDGDS